MTDEASRQARYRRRWRSALARQAATAQGRIVFWAVAVVVGVAAGYAAVGFRLSIGLLQTLTYGADNLTIHTFAAALPWWHLLIVPILGGLAVGWIRMKFIPGGRVLSVADVIAAAAFRDARVDKRAGLASAAASLITLSTGGSTGREGPVVHLAAVIAAWVDDRLDHHGVTARDILGCAVAAAVSASFNAPLAGALFALEVVLRHYALHAFGPIVMASVAGAVISRVHLGEFAQFMLPPSSLGFYEEIPAFMLLGLVAGFAAVILMRALFLAEDLADGWERRLRAHPMVRPAVAGALLGALAIPFPHVIGVGYETTTRALTGGLDFGAAVLFALVKGAALAITYAGRMGGGVFSPSLMIGALTGLAFGAVASGLFAQLPGSEGLYALAGMGAVSAAVLGAPISTTLIVFELTGDWQAAIAVMVSVSVASVVAHRFVWRSFFLSQLKRSGVRLGDGAAHLPGAMLARHHMRLPGGRGDPDTLACEALLREGCALRPDATLEDALAKFEATGRPVLPLAGADGALMGALHEVDALRALNRALIERDRERGG